MIKYIDHFYGIKMPNWCTNSLEVSGNDLQLFVEDVKGKEEEFSFASLIPIPACEGMNKSELEKILTKNQFNYCEFNDKDEAYWYDFCIKNWGTKWDVKDVSVDVDEESANYDFDTAWSPPENWLITISQRYDCHFELTSYEEGNDFWMHLKIEDGKITDHTTLSMMEKVEEELRSQKAFDKVVDKFVAKLATMKYEEGTSVEEIPELSRIVRKLDCEFGEFYIYQFFDDIREQFYEGLAEYGLE